MSSNQTSVKDVFTRGLVKENPIFRLVLGICSSLAVSSTLVAALGMSASVIIVLVSSNIAISLLRNVIPEQVRIPAYIIVIAGFVSIVQMVLQAFVPDIFDMLGIYLPLIVVNCIILGRAEAFANKNSVGMAAIDGLGMGIGYTMALMSIAFLRELIGAGTLFGIQILPEAITPIGMFAVPAGGFIVLGILMAVWNKWAESNGQPKAGISCEGCPSVGRCHAIQAEAEAQKGETK